MLVELAAINAAYSVIKEVVGNGKELSECASSISDFFKHKERLEEKVSKTPEAERSNLEEFFALEDIRRKEQELKDLMLIAGRPGLYDDWVNFQANKEKQEIARRKEAIRKHQEHQEHIQIGLLVVLLFMMIGAIFWFVALLVDG